MRVAVLGGSGKTGRAVCGALRDRDVEAVPLGRAAWPDLAAAVAGADAAYLIAPNLHPDEESYAAAAVSAAIRAGVPRLAYHSVASPYVPAMPHHLGKARAEDVVRRSGLAWTILQPGPYLQNLGIVRHVRHHESAIPGAERDGLSGSGRIQVPYRSDARFGFADLAEVAEVAALVLSDGAHNGATYELASVSATVAGLAAAASVEVEVITTEHWARTAGAGLGEREREWLLAMFAYYDRHGLPVGTLAMRTLLGQARLRASSTHDADVTAQGSGT